MVMEDALLANDCSAHGDIPSTLFRDVHNDHTVTGNIPSPSLSFGSVKSGFINKLYKCAGFGCAVIHGPMYTSSPGECY